MVLSVIYPIGVKQILAITTAEKMSGRVLKTIEWFIDVPDKSSLVGEGQVDSSEFTIVHEESKEDTKWSLRILFQEKRRRKFKIL